MPDDRTRTADAAPPPDATAADGRTPDPGSTRPTSPPYGAAPSGLLSIPGYEVRDELARGGMGRVLEAFDLTFGREVAIKVVLPGPDAAATAGRFVRESRITGRLTHPGIPPAYQLGELPDGSPFLAMKLVRGRTLAALLAERPDVGHDLPRFVSIFEQVCQAVGYAHSRGIIHRDLKPANVMVGAFGEVQVMDWGLARDTKAGVSDPDGPAVHLWDATGSTVADDRTQAGAVMGTPAYMAPEQARGEDVDARADVFALGGLLSMILVGRAPFQSRDANSALVRAAAGDTAEAFGALEGCGADAELLTLARHCLAPEPGDRPADATTAAGLVSAYRVGVEERLRAAERDRAAAEVKVAEQRKRRRVQLALAVAVVLLVAGAGGAAVWRVRDEAHKTAESIRLDGVERTRLEKAGDAIQDQLDAAEKALRAEDVVTARTALGQAERRATDTPVTAYDDRIRSYRSALAALDELLRVDDYRWALGDNAFRSPEEAVEKWTAVLSAHGYNPTEAGSREVVARFRRSPIQSSLLAAFDGCHARQPAAAFRTILDGMDPDPFRSEVRRSREEGAELRGLADHPDWQKQPTWFVRAYLASSPRAVAWQTRLLSRFVETRPDDFGLLMDLCVTYPLNDPATAGARMRWSQAAVSLRPHNAAARMLLATAVGDMGDLAGAIRAFEHAVRLEPRDAMLRYNLAVAYREQKENARSVEQFRAGIALDPQNVLLHYNLAGALEAAGNLPAAVVEYRQAVQADPKHVSSWNNLGTALLALGDVGAAREAYRSALRINPKHVAALCGIGDVFRHERRFAEAADAYRDATRIDPNLANAWEGLGLASVRANRIDDAVTAYRRAVALRPTRAVTHANLANALRDRGEFDAALTSCHTAIKLDPGYALARFTLGNILLTKGGNPRGAIDAYREAIRLDPKHAPSHDNLARVLLNTDDAVGAVAACQEAIRIDPTDARPRILLGDGFMRMGNRTGAAAAYREAIRLAPNNPAAHNGLGIVLAMENNLDAAIASFRAALDADPDDRDARRNLDQARTLKSQQLPTAPPPRAVGR